MVCLWPDGGRLTADLAAQTAEAARRHAAGDLNGAVALCREVLAIDARRPDALHLMGVIACQANNLVLSAQLFEGAIAADPHFAAAWHDHAHVLHRLGRFDEAVRSVRAALEIDPALASAWDMLAVLSAETGARPADIAVCHVKATTLAPAEARFLGNYAAFLLGRGELAQAYRFARRAEQADPNWPPMVSGNVLKAMGHPHLAAERFARVRQLCPQMAEATASEASARLQIGDWQTGWDLWAGRPDLDPAMAGIPLWQGEAGKRVLLYEDQGLGDAVQFARYIPFAASLAGELILRPRAALRSLLAETFPHVRIIDETAPLPAVDARARLADLPVLARTRIETIPAAPYITARAEQVAVWRARLQNLPGPRVGLIWGGNPRFRNDAARSIPTDALAPLFGCGVSWISLQRERPLPEGGAIFDAAPFLHDFADTAAAMAALDLVVSVDTAGAHLAGALGVPVFLLLAFDNDWRWLVGREDSPWYPSARLFRQTRPGDWRGVLTAVAADLRRFAAGDREILRPAPGPQICLPTNPFALALPA